MAESLYFTWGIFFMCGNLPDESGDENRYKGAMKINDFYYFLFFVLTHFGVSVCSCSMQWKKALFFHLTKGSSIKYKYIIKHVTN
jgi:hypothetical protein